MLGVVLNSLSIQNFSVVLANIQILVVVVGKSDLLVVVAELKVGHIIIDFHGGFVRSSSLLSLLRLLLQLLDLLGGLLRFAVEIALVDLADENRGLSPVSALDAQRDLLQDEFSLLTSGHRSERLHLQLTKNVCGCGEITLRLLDMRENTGYTGSLNFDKDLDRIS